MCAPCDYVNAVAGYSIIAPSSSCSGLSERSFAKKLWLMTDVSRVKLRVKSFNSENDFRSDCRNLDRQQKFFSELPSRRSHYMNYRYFWVETNVTHIALPRHSTKYNVVHLHIRVEPCEHLEEHSDSVYQLVNNCSHLQEM